MNFFFRQPQWYGLVWLYRLIWLWTETIEDFIAVWPESQAGGYGGLTTEWKDFPSYSFDCVTWCDIAVKIVVHRSAR